jgi:Ca-activated chloride channel family protein
VSDVALEFSAPYALLALLVVPVVLALDVWLVRRRARRVRELLGTRVATRVDPRGVRRRVACGAVALTSAIVALAGPRAGAPTAERAPVPSDTVVCLDVSRSMLAGDTAPTRLVYAQRCIEQLVQQSPGERFALVVFAGEARVRAPSTADGSALVELLATSGPDDVALGGTDLGAALDAAGRVLAGVRSQNSGALGGRNVLLATDGEDHGGAGLAAAQRLFADGVRVGVLGLGSERGAKIPIDDGTRFLTDASGVEVVSRLDAAGLEALARAGGGEFRAAAGSGDAQELVQLFDALTRERLAAVPPDERPEQRAPVQQWFVAAALAALLVGWLVRGGRS